MTIIYADDSDKIYWPETDSHDPNSKKYYWLDYRPPTRQSSTPYTKGVDVVILPTLNGCMYECVSGGISSSTFTLSNFTTSENKVSIDGDVSWKCKPLICRLDQGDIITESTWSSVDLGVVLDNPTVLNNIKVGTRVTSVSPTLKKFTITNKFTVQRASGLIEEFEKSIVIPVKEL